jgi:hypothetical protein
VFVIPWRDLNANGTQEFGDERLCDPQIAVEAASCRAGELTRAEFTPPVLTAVSVTPATVESGGLVQISAQLNDALSGLLRADLYHTSPTGGQTRLESRPLGGELLASVSFTHAPTVLGQNSYLLRIYDRADNTSSSSPLPVTVVDTTPPLVTVIAPVSGLMNTFTLNAFGTLTDVSALAALQWRVDGGAWRDAPPVENWAFNVTLDAGMRVLEIRAADSLGHVSTPQRLVLYQQPPFGATATFDERHLFTFGTPPLWMEDFVSGEGGAGLSGSNLQAFGAGSRATIFKEKIVPTSAIAVETECEFGREGGMAWTDASGTQWIARVRHGQAQCGPAGALVTSPSLGAVSPLRCVWRNGSISLRVSTASGVPVTLHCSTATLALSALRTMSWEVTGDREIAALSRFSIRAVYADNEYRILDFRNTFRTAWNVRWGTWPGRHYVVQVSPDLQNWIPSETVTATGILTDTLVYAGLGSQPFFVRVREEP